MEGFFIKIGSVSIVFLIIFIVKKIADYFYNKSPDELGGNSMYIVDEKVYKAARLFAQGASNEEVMKIILRCIDFDEEDAEEILSFAEKHRSDDDGGYSSFLKSVNKILGEDVYCITCS